MMPSSRKNSSILPAFRSAVASINRPCPEAQRHLDVGTVVSGIQVRVRAPRIEQAALVSVVLLEIRPHGGQGVALVFLCDDILPDRTPAGCVHGIGIRQRLVELLVYDGHVAILYNGFVTLRDIVEAERVHPQVVRPADRHDVVRNRYVFAPSLQKLSAGRLPPSEQALPGEGNVRVPPVRAEGRAAPVHADPLPPTVRHLCRTVAGTRRPAHGRPSQMLSPRSRFSCHFSSPLSSCKGIGLR